MTEEQKPSPKRKKSSVSRPQTRSTGQLSGLQIMFAAILAVGLILAINFSTRIASSRLQRDVYQNVENEVEQLKLERATLIAERDFVQSDAFVEQWARSEGKMARPGEVLVVPLVPPGAIQPTPTPQQFTNIETSPPEPEPWELWWSLFFDDPPPG